MPETFGRYRLLQSLGEGGMAEVFLAHQEAAAGVVKPCVLKRILQIHGDAERYRQLFLDEARVSALLNHPHIVQTFDFGEIDGTLFLALEFVDGVNLSVLCRKLTEEGRWMPLRAALQIAQQVAEALDYAHRLTMLDGRQLHVVHRDVSPANILVSRQGFVKLADFGIARHEARDEVTQGPQVKGKLGYMAPEQAMAEAVDGRSDIFSLGVVLAELLSARRLFERSAVAAANVLAVPNRVRELCETRTDAPPALLNFIQQMVAIDPEQRPRTAGLVAEQLESFAEALPPSDGLGPFLRYVFKTYLLAHTSPLSPATNSALKTIDPQVTDPHGPATLGPKSRGLERAERGIEISALPAPPGNTSEELKFVRDSWAADEGPTAAIPGRVQSQPNARPAPRKVPRSVTVRERSRAASAPANVRPTSNPMDKPIASLTESPPGAGTPLAFATGQPAAEVDWEKGKTPPSRSAPEVFRPPARRDLRPFAIGAGVLGSVLVLGALIMQLGGNKAAQTDRVGTLKVESDPPGAAIFLGGQPTGKRTPGELTDLPLAHPLTVTVRRPGYLAQPNSVLTAIPVSLKQQLIRFSLERARLLRLESIPAGATVSIGGNTVGATPLELPPLPFGQSATITLSLTKFMKSTVFLPVNASTATVTQVALTPSKNLEILSVPTGARVLLDGTEVGRTPLDALEVPANRKFRVEVTRPGYQSAVLKLNGARLVDLHYSLELRALPLLSMPLQKHEREPAKSLDQRSRFVNEALGRARQHHKKAEATFEKVQAAPGTSIAKMAAAQNSVEVARQRVEDLESQQEELRMEVDEFRSQLMDRLDGMD